MYSTQESTERLDGNKTQEEIITDGTQLKKQLISTIESKVADHALVFMFRSLLGNWVQPIGVWAVRGAAPPLVMIYLDLCWLP